MTVEKVELGLTVTTVPYLKFSVNKTELPLTQDSEVLQLDVELVK